MPDYDRINSALTGFVCIALIWNGFHIDFNVYVLATAFYRLATNKVKYDYTHNINSIT